MRHTLVFGLLSLLVIVCSVLAAGELSHRVHTPISLAPISDGISPDGWVSEDARVEFSNLATRGNFVEIKWNTWRPEGAQPAHVEAKVCGEVASAFTIDSPDPVRIYLKGDCEPRVLDLHFLNPFVPSGEDERRLGAQFKTLQVSSKIGVPIRSLTDNLAAITAIGLLTICVWIGMLRMPFGFFAAFMAPLAATAFVFFSSSEPEKIYNLWTFLAALFLGFAVVGAGVDERGTSERKLFILPLLIVLFGGAIRFYGINFGLPANFHPDEVPKVNAIMRMVEAKTFDPQYFLHPSLLLYTTYGMNTLFHWLGVQGEFRDSAFLAGRFVSAIAGTLSLALTYAIARRLFNNKVAMLAALLLAVFPLHVTCSRYLKEDALLTFNALLTVWVTIISAQSNRPRLLLLAGLFAGFTAASKYSGILAAGIPLAAPWLRSKTFWPDKNFILWAILSVFVAPLGFLTCTPYALLNSPKFLKDFGSESRHMSTGHTVAIDAWSQLWMYHFSRSLIPGMTKFAALLCVAGVGALLWYRRIYGLFIVGLFLMFYMPAEFVKAKPAPQPERYVVPCLPFLAIAGSWLIFQTRTFSRMAWIVAAFAIALPAVRTFQITSEIKNDTRDQMANWMLTNVPKGAIVMMDWKPYGPRFWNNEYEIDYVKRAEILPNLDIKKLKSSGADYLIMSSMFYDRYFSQPDAEPILRQRIREVFERVPAVIQFAPQYGTYGFHNPVLTLFSLKPDDFARLDQEIAMKKIGKINETSNEIKASLRGR